MSSEHKEEKKKQIILPIELESPDKIIQGEKYSKFIKNQCKLFHFLTDLREILFNNYGKQVDCKALHTDLSLDLSSSYSKTEIADAIDRRAKLLHGLKIDLSDMNNYAFMGVGNQAFVLWLPKLESNTDHSTIPHITIGYFRIQGKTCLPESIQQKIIQLAADFIQSKLNNK